MAKSPAHAIEVPVFRRVVSELALEHGQHVAARWLGTTQATLNRWINSGQVPDVEAMRNVAQKLGVTMDALAAHTEEEARALLHAHHVARRIAESMRPAELLAALSGLGRTFTDEEAARTEHLLPAAGRVDEAATLAASATNRRARDAAKRGR